jgi:FAD/FMN-containing dehydrogenase
MATAEPITAIDKAAIEALTAGLRGDLIQAGDPAYDDARRVFNGAVDRHPAMIVRPVDVADVRAALRFGIDHDLRIAVRGGGHHGAGFGTVDDGLVIDLGRMRGIRVDPDTGTVRVEPGCTLADLDHATHDFRLAVPTGIFGTTGIAGLTLGGGVGHLSRSLGLTIDSLIEADVLLASGDLVTASATSNAELFWAIRGGGGNFGIVTSFLFLAHPVSMIVGGPTLYGLDQAEEILRWYRDFIHEAPPDLNGFFAFMTVPPGPPFPEDLHLRKMAGIVWCYAGDPSKADEVFAPIHAFGPPALDWIQPMPFPALQTMFDPLYPAGLRWHWRTDFVTTIPDEAIAEHVRFASALPNWRSGMHLYPIDGAVHGRARGDTPFDYREARWAQVMVGVDDDASTSAATAEWTTNYWEALHPYSAGGAYVNMYMEEGQERVRSSYRDSYARLAKAKAQFDPDNVFRVNQNIRPSRDQGSPGRRIKAASIAAQWGIPMW